jgi:hypothetical protein
MVLVVAVVLGLLIVGLLVELERRGQVELEWNPFSYASRAARAERRGALGEALVLYDRAGGVEPVCSCLRRNLRDSELRTALLDTTREVLDLREGLSVLGDLTSLNLTAVGEPVAGFVYDAVASLWWTAERIAAVMAIWGPLDPLPEVGDAEVARMAELRTTIRRVRAELAGLILAEPSRPTLATTIERSTALADTIHALAEARR